MTERRLREGQDSDPPIDWPGVWHEHGPWLRMVLLARLRDGHLVDEIFQEIALVVSRKPERWPDRTRIAPWLYRVAVRQVQLHRRKQYRRRERFADDQRQLDRCPDHQSIDPVTWMIDREAEQHVQTALAEMTDQDREILMLKHTQHWTYRQIAEHLGISNDKIIYRLGRAREVMKNRLADQCRYPVEP